MVTATDTRSTASLTSVLRSENVNAASAIATTTNLSVARR